MTKIIIFLLSAAFVFGFISYGAPEIFATVDVASLDLDKTTVKISCPAYAKNSVCDDDMKIKVSAEAPGAKNGVAIFRYTVSGGNIVGTGANVYWDLNGVKPGTYTIAAAAADDGFGFNGETQTAQVSVSECVECYAECLECPTLSIKGPSHIVKKGEIIEFEAIVSGGSQDEITYNWAIDKNGEIIEGQGMSKIKVKVLKSDIVTATVEIGGLCESCLPVSGSETTPIP